MSGVLLRVGVGVLRWLLTTPRGRAVLGALLAAVIALPLGLLIMISTATTQQAQVVTAQAVEEQEACFEAAPDDTTQVATTWTALSADQQTNARTIIGVVRAAYVAPGSTDDTARQSAAMVAIATAMQESRLTNLDHGDRDSLGLFQQRPSQGWGTPAQLTDPVYAATAFLYGVGPGTPGLVDVPGWQTIPVAYSAQAVQRSAYPAAYARWQTFARSVVDAAWTTTTPVSVAAALDRADLATAAGVLHSATIHVPASSGDGCDLVTSDPVDTTWDGTYHKPASWGYPNGAIPLQVLCRVPWAPTQMARCDAVDALVRLNQAWKVDHGGQNIGITDSYRDLAAQQDVRDRKGDLAARVGHSNHGLGLALDLRDFGAVGQYDAPNYLWMKAHGSAYGWVHPPFMEAGGSGPLEPWHWEYQGVYQSPLTPSGTGPTV